MLTRSIQTLLAGVVDYAGLFPPAKLAMGPAVENYARDRAGLHEWMLGRFICPVSRLRELSQAAAALMPGTFATSGYREHAEIGEPWRISALIDGAGGASPLEGLKRDLDTIVAFNTHHAAEDKGLAQIDCVEIKPPSPEFIDAACEVIPDDLYPFFEIAGSGGMDPRGLLAALPGHAAAAKIRTGGVTADAFPTARAVAEFLHACALAGVAFKATAGLHHPVRGPQRCTYDKDAPTATMHGFLNLFVAATALYTHRLEPEAAAAILEETDAGAFVFTDDGITCRRLVVEPAQLAKAREVFCLSFGSCSFDEPVGELKAMHLL